MLHIQEITNETEINRNQLLQRLEHKFNRYSYYIICHAWYTLMDKTKLIIEYRTDKNPERKTATLFFDYIKNDVILRSHNGQEKTILKAVDWSEGNWANNISILVDFWLFEGFEGIEEEEK